jgi:FixJ family two-component response regulator
MTERFNISKFFIGKDRAVTKEAVKKSDLPEGVNVIKGFEVDGAKKPFVVVTWDNNVNNEIKAFHAGAIDCVQSSVDSDELAERLTSKK